MRKTHDNDNKDTWQPIGLHADRAIERSRVKSKTEQAVQNEEATAHPKPECESETPRRALA